MAELKTYSTQITEYIKASLLSGELKPGDKVKEAVLASTLSISRAPVREALQMLVSDGLIVSIPQRGKFIRTLTSQDIYNHYSLGGVLEGAAVTSCIHLFTDDDFSRLEYLYRNMETLDESDQRYAKALAEFDVEFHDTLVAKAPNKLMVDYARTVCQRISKFLLYHHWPGAFSHSEVLARHRKVLDAVHSKSPTVIEKSLRTHYNELGLRMNKFGTSAKKN